MKNRLETTITSQAFPAQAEAQERSKQQTMKEAMKEKSQPREDT